MTYTPPPAHLPSTKPYLLRAIWEWCNDNGFTPHILVRPDASCRVPSEFVKQGQIALNIGLEATQNLQMKNALITFQARFGGVAREVRVPVARVEAVYARENGAGMGFEVEEYVEGEESGEDSEKPEPQNPPEPVKPARPSHLQLVK